MPRTSLALIGSAVAAPRTTCPEDFRVQVGFQGGWAIVAVHGEVDAMTAPTLRTMLDGLVAGGHALIVLDLEAVSFMGAEGLGVVVGTLGRLRLAEGALILRSARAPVLRLLEITGLAGQVTTESVDHGLAAALTEQGSRTFASDLVAMSDDEMDRGITDALRSRLVLAQAQGVLMARHRLTADEATEMLHRMARTAGVSVLEHATQLVAATDAGAGPLERLGDG